MDSYPLTKDFVEDFDKRTRGLRFIFSFITCKFISNSAYIYIYIYIYEFSLPQVLF